MIELLAVAGRGLQPRPKRLTDEDRVAVIENGRDGGATPVPLGRMKMIELLTVAGRGLTVSVSRGNEKGASNEND